MPHTKSAAKRLKTSTVRRAGNRAAKSAIHTTRLRLYEAVAQGDQAASEKLYREYCSHVDKAAKQGSIKDNAASRRKSRAALYLRSHLKA